LRGEVVAELLHCLEQCPARRREAVAASGERALDDLGRGHGFIVGASRAACQLRGDAATIRAVTAQRWRVVLWAAMLAVVGLLVWQARATLLPFALGAILAYALSPL